MRISRVLPAAVAALWLGALAVGAGQSPEKPAATPTYAKDVAPILFKNCTACHRPGEIAPMSLLTYDDVRPHAKAIRDEVSEGHMPPWHAAAPKGTFLNERGLTDDERKTLLAWANDGAPKGDPKDLPPAARLSRRLGDGQAGRRLRDAGGQGSRRGGHRDTSISTSRRTSPSRSGFRRSSCGPATARSCTTRSPSTRPSRT